MSGTTYAYVPGITATEGGAEKTYSEGKPAPAPVCSPDPVLRLLQGISTQSHFSCGTSMYFPVEGSNRDTIRFSIICHCRHWVWSSAAGRPDGAVPIPSSSGGGGVPADEGAGTPGGVETWPLPG
jgi:hypothetical protein